ELRWWRDAQQVVPTADAAVVNCAADALADTGHGQYIVHRARVAIIAALADGADGGVRVIAIEVVGHMVRRLRAALYRGPRAEAVIIGIRVPERWHRDDDVGTTVRARHHGVAADHPDAV